MGKAIGAGFIRAAIKNGRAVHAAVITGADRETCFARALAEAKALVCREENAPCGVCDQCVKAEHGSHPDIKTVQAEQDKKEITVDQIRAVRREAFVVPNEAERKVFVIRAAGMMNLYAQNAFLKVLEEPPSRVVFLLAEEEPGLLLPTVRSRCWMISAEGPEQESRRIPEAEKFVSLINAGDELAIAEFCAGIEKNDKRTMTELLEGISEEISRDLRRCAESGKDTARLVKEEELLNELRQMADFNVGPGHIAGKLLAGTAAIFLK